MKVLAIDSSAKTASVGILDEGKLITELFVNAGLTHSQTLMSMVDNALARVSMDIDDIDVFGVNSGPGSYTGIRIGVSAVKGMAFPRETPCAGISTLESLAMNLSDLDCIACCVMDARCNQVYNANFRIENGNIIRLCEDRAISMPELLKELMGYSELIYLVGDGAELCYNSFINETDIKIAPYRLRYQSAHSVGLLAIKYIERGEAVSPDELVPSYLRLSQAERELNKKNLMKG